MKLFQNPKAFLQVSEKIRTFHFLSNTISHRLPLPVVLMARLATLFLIVLVDIQSIFHRLPENFSSTHIVSCNVWLLHFASLLLWKIDVHVVHVVPFIDNKNCAVIICDHAFDKVFHLLGVKLVRAEKELEVIWLWYHIWWTATPKVKCFQNPLNYWNLWFD